MDTTATDRTGDVQTVFAVFEQLPVSYCAVSGPDHVYVAANRALREWLNARQLLGKTVREVYPEIQGQQLIEELDRVYATGQPVITPEWRVQIDLDGSGSMDEVFLDLVYSPLRDAGGEIIGVITQVADATERVRQRRAEQRRAEDAERRYQAARDVVSELQQALLPTTLPVLPGVKISARYLVAAEDQRAGGDWFDAIPLRDGRVALIVGDIVGHGVTASAAMGQLRAVLGRALIETNDLDQALAWVDRLAGESTVMRAATLGVVVLDASTGAMQYVTCGHPPPLAVTPQGSARYLPISGAGPLGTRSPLVTATAVLESGELVLLYSDGLIERAGHPLDERLRTFAAVAADAAANRALPLGASSSATERASQQCVEIMTRHGYDDDVTLLVAQRRPQQVPTWHEERLAVPDELSALRTGLLDWLDLLEVGRKDSDNIDLAVSELAANVIEHAYPDGDPGPVRVHAELAGDGRLIVQVADDGLWRPLGPPPATSGRGIWFASAAVDELVIERRGGIHPTDPTANGPSAQGTLVTVRHRVTHPAQLVADSAPGPTPKRTVDFAAHFHEGPPRVVHVQGDIATAAQLADRLDIASRGGVHPLTIDLSDVDVLASAGVRVLFHLQNQLATHGHPLDVIAADHTLAARVLDLTGLTRHAPPH